MKMTQEQVEIIEKLANDGYAEAIHALCDDCVEAAINCYRKSIHRSAMALTGSAILGCLTTVVGYEVIKHFKKKKEESES